ncbi:MAG TPA: tetratricopeptide repeat protein, partial [Actinomycetota bacterium]|nr:tetratricopeptide repeat protein [Actinomycetota bacterium]
ASGRGDEAATVLLAEILLERGEIEEAGEVLSTIPRTGEAARMASIVELHRWATTEGDLGTVARDSLGGDGEGALERCLKLIAEGKDAGQARSLAVSIFAFLGEADPLTAAYRKRLAAILY